MNTIWILIIVAVYSDGNVKTQLNFPQKSEWNNEKVCNDNGKELSRELQIKLGTENAKVYFYCDGVPRSEVTKSVNGV